jgi:hypothetical protein
MAIFGFLKQPEEVIKVPEENSWPREKRIK